MNDWQKEERKIYIRDGIFLAGIILFSILFAEYIVIEKNATAVDRIFAYLFTFIPLGTLNLLAHYYYRNRRIKLTGNLRTSLRYQISLFFMFVIIIPSVPFFILTSNIVERIVAGVFRADVGQTLEHAARIIDSYTYNEAQMRYRELKDQLRMNVHQTSSHEVNIDLFYKKKYIQESLDYAAIFEQDHYIAGNFPFFKNEKMPHASFEIEQGVPSLLYRKGKAEYLVFSYRLKDQKKLIFALRIHPALDQEIYAFRQVYGVFKDESVVRELIPNTLRLWLAVVFLIMISLTFLASIILSHQISYPIIHLAEATRSVTDGDLQTRISLNAPGELGTLIESFNQMTSELESMKSKIVQDQRVAAWQEVARRLAHEIKNPLTPILLSADRMLRRLDHPEKGNLDSVVRNGAETIIVQVHILKKMLEEFSQFARLPSINKQFGNINDVVSKALHLYAPLKDVKIEFQPGIIPSINFDESAVTGMIHNLIKNSLEAIEESKDNYKGPGRILIATSVLNQGRKKFLQIKFEDSGPGIEESIREKIFEPYYSTKDDGTGLGLAIVERIVLDHDGRIMIGTSSLGGAEFRIFFEIKES